MKKRDVPSTVGASQFVTDRRDAGPALHGDIFICLDDAVAQARQFRSTWPSELVRYMIHGLLHLRGYDDRQPGARRKMKRVENRLLRAIGQRFVLARLEAPRAKGLVAHSAR